MFHAGSPVLRQTWLHHLHRLASQPQGSADLSMALPAAETSCRRSGGHLASFASNNEQTEAEQAFMTAGWLLPAFHKGYWIGLRASRPGQWRWLDK